MAKRKGTHAKHQVLSAERTVDLIRWILDGNVPSGDYTAAGIAETATASIGASVTPRVLKKWAEACGIVWDPQRGKPGRASRLATLEAENAELKARLAGTGS